MALTTAYVMAPKTLESFFNTLQTARAPERFTTRLLTDLGFANSNDRLLIGVLKGLGFLDENAVPTQRYFDFLDQTRAGAILAQAVREAYGDLFALNTRAHEMSVEDVKNKLRTLTRGEKSDRVVSLMASTFRALADVADWEAPAPLPAVVPENATPHAGRHSANPITTHFGSITNTLNAATSLQHSNSLARFS